jgi:hypothetical protein
LSRLSPSVLDTGAPIIVFRSDMFAVVMGSFSAAAGGAKAVCSTALDRGWM